jgi:superoxide dismutase, Fe-Mn family
MFELKPLPYPENALEPHISAETLRLHHGKHHQKYVDTLNELIEGTTLADRSLPEIIRLTYGQSKMQAIFNNAGQVWNHDLFWSSMKPDASPPTLAFREWVGRDFGTIDAFKDAFKKAAVGQFGSGWAWLVLSPDGNLKITTTSNAESPLIGTDEPLLTCDVWEHAYYLDYQNRRADFVDAFLNHLINWDLVAAELQRRPSSVEPTVKA